MTLGVLSDAATINPRGPAPSELSADLLCDFVPMAAVGEDGSICVSQTRRYAEVMKGFTAFKNGDVLLAKITPCFENNKIALASTRSRYAFGSTEFHVIRPKEGKLDAKYLSHYLRQDRIRFLGERRMTGSAGQRRVPKSFLSELEIPLPPIEEQRRISEILDNADAIRRKREQALSLAEAFLISVYQQKFGDPVLNSHGYPEIPFGEIADITSGLTKGRKLTGMQELRSVPYMRVANVQDGHLDLSEVKSIEATSSEIEKFRLLDGDILLTEGGDPDKLGRGCVWHSEVNECIHQNHIFRARLLSSVIFPEVLSRQIASRRGKEYFLREAKQTTGIATINKRQLSAYPVLVPGKDEQEAFMSILTRFSQQLETLRVAAQESQTLFEALSQRAFRGEL